MIPRTAACGNLAAAFEVAKDADGEIENLYLAMSQTPCAIKHVDDNYRALLQNADNPLEP